MTKEEFINQRMEIDKVTRKHFNKNYVVIQCTCGKSYCNGWRCLMKDDIDIDLFNYIQNLQQRIDKAIEILGKYKHYYSPEPEQNSKNEDIVMKVLSILQVEKVKE